MPKYRDRLQIVADILSIASSRAKKTQIMYRANLSYKLLCKYLSEILNAGLICLETKDSYGLTSKGKEFLSEYEGYLAGCKRLKRSLDRLNGRKIVLEKMCPNTNMIGNYFNRLDKQRKSTKQRDEGKLERRVVESVA